MNCYPNKKLSLQTIAQRLHVISVSVSFSNELLSKLTPGFQPIMQDAWIVTNSPAVHMDDLIFLPSLAMLSPQT